MLLLLVPMKIEIITARMVLKLPPSRGFRIRNQGVGADLHWSGSNNVALSRRTLPATCLLENKCWSYCDKAASVGSGSVHQMTGRTSARSRGFTSAGNSAAMMCPIAGDDTKLVVIRELSRQLAVDDRVEFTGRNPRRGAVGTHEHRGRVREPRSRP